MANFVKCDIPKGIRLRGYGDNQRLIEAFNQSGYACAKVTDFTGNINSFTGRLTRCAKNLNMSYIKCVRVGGDSYLLNTLIKEDC